MSFARCRPLLLVLLLFPLLAVGDVAVPPNVLDPQSAADAWNVLRLATGNVARLLEEKRLGEITVQISLCSPALRALEKLGKPEDAERLRAAIGRGVALINETAIASSQADQERTTAAFQKLREVLAETAHLFEPAAVKAEIHVCPMHPDIISPDAATPCVKCGMSLLPRRIPYSFIYVTPGAPSMILTAVTSAPLQAGQKTDVTVRLQRRDGSPVLLADLLVMHTQPIHLLIVDPTLGDYHHEHPTPTGTPGEYAFAFTPMNDGPYRVWADLVPAATGLQEYPVVDLPGAARGGTLVKGEDRLEATAGGLRFKLTHVKPGGGGLRAGQIANLLIAVSDADGKPVRTLEPVMNAFAHLVGFYEDFQTVVHLHPAGGDVVNPELRGGPSMGFKFYPPKAGFLRHYCQVMVAGQMIFAPFDMNIAASE
jgi:hypothetical protein